MTKIGVIVDGSAEAEALAQITDRFGQKGIQILKPIYADMQPKSTPEQIAKAALDKVKILIGRSVSKIVVLIDYEKFDPGDGVGRPFCPGLWAKQIEKAFVVLGNITVNVVVKWRNLENWLIADPNSFKSQAGRYEVSSSFEKQTSPNRADSVNNAEILINQILKDKKRPYHKRTDAIAIAKKLSIEVAGLNSRSFRRFLRLLGHPKYLNQSLRPAT